MTICSFAPVKYDGKGHFWQKGQLNDRSGTVQVLETGGCVDDI